MSVQFVEMDHETLEGTGSFCLRSKKSTEGYIQKNKWLHDRFEDGLKYVQLIEDKKQVGFIEYTDAECSSRVVYANDYVVIHCLWVSELGKGYGSKLIQKCIEDAKRRKKNGVGVVTNSQTAWTPSKDIFLKNHFVVVDTALEQFELLVYPFDENAESPSFPTDWVARTERFHDLTILRSFQCPYVEVATANIVEGAKKLGIGASIIEITNREELMRLSPTPYGIYAVIYKGQLITFHRLTVHSVIKRLRAMK
jgi:L-amino acid N-acyltransferase YncA